MISYLMLVAFWRIVCLFFVIFLNIFAARVNSI